MDSIIDKQMSTLKIGAGKQEVPVSNRVEEPTMSINVDREHKISYDIDAYGNVENKHNASGAYSPPTHAEFGSIIDSLVTPMGAHATPSSAAADPMNHLVHIEGMQTTVRNAIDMGVLSVNDNGVLIEAKRSHDNFFKAEIDNVRQKHEELSNQEPVNSTLLNSERVLETKYASEQSFGGIDNDALVAALDEAVRNGQPSNESLFELAQRSGSSNEQVRSDLNGHIAMVKAEVVKHMTKGGLTKDDAVGIIDHQKDQPTYISMLREAVMTNDFTRFQSWSAKIKQINAPIGMNKEDLITVNVDGNEIETTVAVATLNNWI